MLTSTSPVPSPSISPLFAVVLLVMVALGASLILYSVYEDLLPSEQEVGEAERGQMALKVDTGRSYASWALELNVTNPHSFALTDYQVRVHLNAFNFQNWSLLSPERVYFTLDPDGNTPLPYWVEDFDATAQNAVFWVKVPSIPAGGNASIYMWLSPNNAYPEYNDPSQVFIIFDDFDTINTAFWSTAYLTDYVVSSSVLRINIGGLTMVNPLTFPLQDGYAVETRVLVHSTAGGYSGTFPEFSSSTSTRSSNTNADATILFMRNTGSTSLSVWVGDGSTASYNIVSGSTVGTLSDGTWYITGAGANATGMAVWVNDPSSPVYSHNSITWAKDMRYIVLGAFHAAQGGSTYDIQDTSYDWMRLRKWVFPEPSAINTGNWVESTTIELYVRNIGKAAVTLDRVYVEDYANKTLLYTRGLGVKLPAGSVEKIVASFTGEHTGGLLVTVVTKEGTKARFVARAD